MSDSLLDYDTKQAASEGREMPIAKPDPREPGFFRGEDGNPWTITLLGEDSQVFRRSWHKLKSEIFEKSVQGETLSDDEMTHLEARFAAECTVGWKGVSLGEGELPFSKEKAAELYERFPWLLRQVMGFIENRANFIQRPSDVSKKDSAGRSKSTRNKSQA